MTSTLPTGRYAAPKRRPRRRRNSTVAVLALGVIAGIVIAVVAYRNLAPGPISGEDLGFSLDGNSATVRFTVSRDDPSRPAVCIIRALSVDGSETGRREMYIPPSATGMASYVGTVRTSHPPVVGNVFGCSYSVPLYLQPR
ncbi:MAG: DUF4307 domain-containing protein [Mycobacteriaceae bacterium]